MKSSLVLFLLFLIGKGYFKIIPTMLFAVEEGGRVFCYPRTLFWSLVHTYPQGSAS